MSDWKRRQKYSECKRCEPADKPPRPQRAKQARTLARTALAELWHPLHAREKGCSMTLIDVPGLRVAWARRSMGFPDSRPR